jgi:hypothetical protein
LLVSFDVLACNISKSGKKKEKSSDPKFKKLVPHLSKITRSMEHTTRETYKREIFTKRERQRLREREIEEFPHTKLATTFLQQNLRAKVCCKQ